MKIMVVQSSADSHAKRYLSSFALSALLYTLLATLLFWGMPKFDAHSLQEPLEPTLNRVKVTLATLQKAPAAAPTPPQVKSEPQPLKETKAISHAKKSIPPQKAKPLEVAQKAVAKPEQKPVIEPVNTLAPQPTTATELTSSIATDSAATSQTTDTKISAQPVRIEADALKAKQAAFYAQLRSLIDANKIYPKSARRRGAQGEVEMQFLLLADGSVSSIKMLSGKSIFERSAMEAIEKSFPVSVEKELFKYPKEFTVTLVYLLK